MLILPYSANYQWKISSHTTVSAKIEDMPQESTLQRLFRKLILARYTDNDTVLVLRKGSRVFERVKDLRTISSFERAWTHIWYVLVLIGALLTAFITILILVVPAETRFGTGTTTDVLLAAFGLLALNLFLGVQGLAVISYFRWRLKFRRAGNTFPKPN